jgi:hypothetical protein
MFAVYEKTSGFSLVSGEELATMNGGLILLDLYIILLPFLRVGK